MAANTSWSIPVSPVHSDGLRFIEEEVAAETSAEEEEEETTVTVLFAVFTEEFEFCLEKELEEKEEMISDVSCLSSLLQ